MNHYYKPYYGKITNETLMACHECGWIGEKKNVPESLDIYMCPKCFSLDIIPVEKYMKMNFYGWYLVLSLAILVVAIFLFVFASSVTGNDYGRLYIFVMVALGINLLMSSFVFKWKNL